MPDAAVVVDAAAMVDMLLGNPTGAAVRQRLRGHALHAPSHFDAEVLSALGRLYRSDQITGDAVAAGLRQLLAAPVTRHPVTDLLLDTWAARDRHSLVDGLYVTLCQQAQLKVVTTDARLARATPLADFISS